MIEYQMGKRQESQTPIKHLLEDWLSLEGRIDFLWDGVRGNDSLEKNCERWIEYRMTKNDKRITSVIAHIKHLLGDWLSLEGRTEFFSMGNDGFRGRVPKYGETIEYRISNG